MSEKDFLSWNNTKDFKNAIDEYGQAISSTFNEGKSSFGLRTIRPEFNRDDYDSFRKETAVPKKKSKAISLSNKAYKYNGIIRNIVDLMSDFACQGIRLAHKNKSAENFYQHWFEKINGKERSERFLNNLYRLGNVFVYRSYANVTPKMVEYIKSVGSDISIPKDFNINDKIPLKYTFFNPLAIDINNEGKFTINISNGGKIFHGPGVFDVGRQNFIPKHVYDNLPAEMRKQIKENKAQIELDDEKLRVFYYKKDDWEDWADPMIAPIIDDIFMLERMRLADFAALDGAISNIRLWTLGSLDHKILPNKGAIDRLRQILASNQGGGMMELVWGPELDFKESSTDVHKFLGSAKYEAPLNAIYAGLGIPPSLTGQASSTRSGFTNNSISLKTLIERLEYGRTLLLEFWRKEIELVRKSMGFRYPAEVMFDQMSIADENAEKALLIQLADRNIISDETLVERFKVNPEIEKSRIKQEAEERDTGDLPVKTSPFHNANFDKEMEKLDKQLKHSEKLAKEKTKNVNNGVPTGQNGRPQGVKDTSPRDQRTPKIRSSTSVAKIVRRVYDSWELISEHINNSYLNHINKNNLRQLSKAEIKTLEHIKIDVLTNIPLNKDPTIHDIISILSQAKKAPIDFINNLEENNIKLEKIGLENFRKEVLSTYIGYTLSNF
jgi:hypothetical protein